jgi:hypothetical protein
MRDQWLALIGSLLGGLGIGTLLVTVLTKWLEGKGERKRWLRDQRHAAYAAIAKELLPLDVLLTTTHRPAPSEIIAEVRLLLDDERPAEGIEAFFEDVGQTRQRLGQLVTTLQSLPAGTPRDEHQKLAKEYAAQKAKELERLKHEANEIIAALRQQLLRQ